MTYAFPPGGLPAQDVSPESTAIFTEAYAVIPASTQRDIIALLTDYIVTDVTQPTFRVQRKER